MQSNRIDIELEPEDVELLSRIERETGKSVSQLTLEAIRATYKSDFDSDRAEAIALLEAIHKLQQQTREVLAAVQKQRYEIEKFSNRSNSNRSKQDAQQFYPPPA
jgi:protein-disulfide isomerase-like protein with CxxC motif